MRQARAGRRVDVQKMTISSGPCAPPRHSSRCRWGIRCAFLLQRHVQGGKNLALFLRDDAHWNVVPVHGVNGGMGREREELQGGGAAAAQWMSRASNCQLGASEVPAWCQSCCQKQRRNYTVSPFFAHGGGLPVSSQPISRSRGRLQAPTSVFASCLRGALGGAWRQIGRWLAITLSLFRCSPSLLLGALYTTPPGAVVLDRVWLK